MLTKPCYLNIKYLNLLLFCFTDTTDILKVWKKKKGWRMWWRHVF